MKLLNYIQTELNYFNKYEKILYLSVILSVIIISIAIKDSKIAIISAICGITYTLLAGKGKVYCYYTGIIGTFCYCIIAYKNGFYGNMCLYGLYFLPMQIIGIFNWRKHLNKKTNEIIKTKLSNKERFLYFITGIILTGLIYKIILMCGGKSPIMDAFSVGFSVLGQYLTLKRCIEQWIIWFIVNLITLFIWLNAYLNESHCFATVLMWLIYLILAVYFYIKWRKEIKNGAVL